MTNERIKIVFLIVFVLFLFFSIVWTLKTTSTFLFDAFSLALFIQKLCSNSHHDYMCFLFFFFFFVHFAFHRNILLLFHCKLKQCNASKKKYRATQAHWKKCFEAHDQRMRHIFFVSRTKKKKIIFFYQFRQWHESPTYFMISFFSFRDKSLFFCYWISTLFNF